MNIETLTPILKTYLRAAAAAAAALFIADSSRPLKDYFIAGLAAILGPIMKAIDPKELDFGKGSK
jgi:hypothetical protein